MKLIIMRGISGAGKSTWVKNNYPEAIVCSADDYFIKDGEYVFNQARIGDAHIACFAKFVEACNRKDPVVIIDNTNTQLWEMTPYTSYGRYSGYEVKIIEISTDKETAVARNVHGVSEKIISGMARRFQKCLPWWNSQTIRNN